MVIVLKRKNYVILLSQCLLVIVSVAIGLLIGLRDIPTRELLLSSYVGFKPILYAAILILSLFLNDLYQVQVMINRRALMPRLVRSSLVSLVVYASTMALFPEQTQGRVAFASSLLLVNAGIVALFLILQRSLESRPLLERVLVLGEGRLADTLRQSLLSGDYRQALVDDQRVEAAALEALYRAGNGEAAGLDALEQLRDEIDLMVVAFDGELFMDGRSFETGLSLVSRKKRRPQGRLLRFQSHEERRQRRVFVRSQRQKKSPQERLCYPVEGILRGLIVSKLKGLRILRGLDYYEELTGRVYIGQPADPMFFSHAQFRIDKLSFAIKALWERLLASVIFVLVLPWLALVPLAIWLDDGRPLLFVQPRVGRGGRVYRLFKWRSMDDKGNITRVGKIIRKTKLDELPQLINVLRGEMSLVGPRPELPRFVDEFQAANAYYHLRHMVRPGLTGWAQIMFPDARAEDAMTKLAYDLYYVKHFSLISDMVIMAETFKMIVFGGYARLKRQSAPRVAASNSIVPPLKMVENKGLRASSSQRSLRH